jgi:hypothetical protein
LSEIAKRQFVRQQGLKNVSAASSDYQYSADSAAGCRSAAPTSSLTLTDRDRGSPQLALFSWRCHAGMGLSTPLRFFPRIPKGTWRAALESAAGEPLENMRGT